ncbi:pyridoxal phosphate-dependent transferase [Emericellopsis atlantica]|uniref:Pyridoxal phosphate-dependent transferase n=1 Tax=Emericellopsis atlantica TaxID=2614577 RepID=A0A9P7ZL97_9HYPO|nr:pyridoxal phosphate-dependent transferase [Emericellopsis atlantica]KAG9254021.1 pyridoxal phosphate-dependent transferase [Emericellopsis atlantica]
MLLKNIHRESAANEYRGTAADQTMQQYVQQLAAELAQKFQDIGPDTFAHLLLSLLLGRSALIFCAFMRSADCVVLQAIGTVPVPVGDFKAMKEMCDKYGTLLIMDEVISGMGRVGWLHAWEQKEVVPDIETKVWEEDSHQSLLCSSTTAWQRLSGEVLRLLFLESNIRTRTFSDGHTYQGHRVECATALEVQRIIKEDNLVDNIRENGEYLGKLLHRHLDSHPYVGNIRGRGFFWLVLLITLLYLVDYDLELMDLKLGFVADKKTKELFSPSAAIASKAHSTALNNTGISLCPETDTKDGVNGDHVLLAPAYTITSKDVGRIAGKVKEVVVTRAYEKI